jgi:hypothetical protein
LVLVTTTFATEEGNICFHHGHHHDKGAHSSSISHHLTLSIVSSGGIGDGGGFGGGDLSHPVVSELRRRYRPGIKRSYGDNRRRNQWWCCRRRAERVVLCLSASFFVMILVAVPTAIVLRSRGMDPGGSPPGYDVNMWGDAPGDREACCVNGDLARPGDLLLALPEEGDGGEQGTTTAVPPLSDSGIFDGSSNGGGDPPDPDPIELAPLGDDLLVGMSTAPPTRGPTRARGPTVGPSKRVTASPTLDPAPEDGPELAIPTQEPSSPSTSPTPGPNAASPSASPTSRAPTTTSPTTDMPVTESPVTAPFTGAPVTGAPFTVTAEAPSTGAPFTGAPITGAPFTGKPAPAEKDTAAPTTASPSASPITTAPVTGLPGTLAPTLSPSEMPTTSVMPKLTEHPTAIFSECPDKVEDGINYEKEDMVSYRSTPMWKVYQCLGGACVAEGLTPEIPAETWTLLGFCVSTDDQLNGDAGDLTKVNPSRHHPDGG